MFKFYSCFYVYNAIRHRLCRFCHCIFFNRTVTDSKHYISIYIITRLLAFTFAGQGRSVYVGWIGAMQSDRQDESSHFIWRSTGTPLDNDMWCPHQPDDYQSREDHVDFFVQFEDKRACFNDQADITTRNCICEFTC